MALESILFGVGVAAAGLIILTLVATLTTDIRFWPPGSETRKAMLHWGLVGVFDICLVGLAVLRWNRWLLPRPALFLVGLGLSIVGAGLFVYSFRKMTPEETTGQTADILYTDGPYAYSRNPQYLGIIVGMIGFALLVNSRAVAILSTLHVTWVVLLPFAEEPWLREQFGAEYDQYRETVPRFIGLRPLLA